MVSVLLLFLLSSCSLLEKDKNEPRAANIFVDQINFTKEKQLKVKISLFGKPYITTRLIKENILLLANPKLEDITDAIGFLSEKYSIEQSGINYFITFKIKKVNQGQLYGIYERNIENK